MSLVLDIMKQELTKNASSVPQCIPHVSLWFKKITQIKQH